MTQKELKDFKTERAQWEFDLRVLQLMENFVSKEEPSIKLSKEKKIGILADIVSKYFKNKKS